MDLTKLNNEFAEIQNKLNEYDLIKNNINKNIKVYEKEILKLKAKIKLEKNCYLKQFYELMIISNNESIRLLKSLIEKTGVVSK